MSPKLASKYFTDRVVIEWFQGGREDDDDYIHIKVLGGYYDAGDHVKFGFPMAAMTVKALKSCIELLFDVLLIVD